MLDFIGSSISPEGAPVALVKAAHQFAILDYGTQGPQLRVGAQLTEEQS
jgi:hypothetical protein